MNRLLAGWAFILVSAKPPHAEEPYAEVQGGVDDEELQALWVEGLDPYDPAVVAALDLVRWELSLCAHDYDGGCGPRGANGQSACHP
ncbi:MAG: hypothetical protein ACRDTV_19715 [Mycobacterium sp.]